MTDIRKTLNKLGLTSWPRIVAAAGLLAMAFSLQGHAQMADASDKSKIYVFDYDFPPSCLAQSPIPSQAGSKFWSSLHQAMAAQPNVELTDKLEEADYRVTLRCTGLRACTKLLVTIADADRNNLASYRVGARNWLAYTNYDKVSSRLAMSVNEHVTQLESGELLGDVGVYHPPKPVSAR